MNTNRLCFVLMGLLVFCMGICANEMDENVDLKQFFAMQTFEELPPNVEIISEKVEDGVKTTALKFDGGMINGKPTRIFAYYARPAKKGVYPGVLVIHGAGLTILNPDTVFCKQGFASLTIDWAGEAKKRKVPRTPPFSEFESNGNLADKLSGQWKLCGVEEDGIRVGVIFAQRGLEFLRNQQEVDSKNLFTVGSSAGAHLSLILLGIEPTIKASVVKYGTGFIRDIPGSYGGYFGPVTLCSKPDQDNWLAHFDPKHNIGNYKAKVLLLSGTDDIFFWMRNVLMTYKAIPTEKRLLMRPNDNHQWVGSDPVSLKFFQDTLNHSPLHWPDAPAPTIKEADGKIIVTVTPASTTPLKSVRIVWKSSPLGKFQHKNDWNEITAQMHDSVWTAQIGQAETENQIVAYGFLTDEDGRIASTDTVEFPEFPAWRGLNPAN